MRAGSNMIDGTILKGRGFIKGPADIHMLHCHAFWAIEVKYGDNRPEDEQYDWADDVAANGGRWVACWLVEDAWRYFGAFFPLPPAAEVNALMLDATWQRKVAGYVKPPSVETRARLQVRGKAATRRKVEMNDALPF